MMQITSRIQLTLYDQRVAAGMTSIQGDHGLLSRFYLIDVQYVGWIQSPFRVPVSHKA